MAQDSEINPTVLEPTIRSIDPTDEDPTDDFLDNKSGLTSEIESIIAAIAAIMGIAAIAGAATAGAPLGGFQF